MYPLLTVFRRIHPPLICLTSLIILIFPPGCSDNSTEPETQLDTEPPAAIKDLDVVDSTANSIKLTWTAPGDDGMTGNATQYDVRFSANQINSSNWESAAACFNEAKPGDPNNTEIYIALVLPCDNNYYFAVKTADESGNWSDLSNVVSGRTIWCTGGSVVAWGYNDHGECTVPIPNNDFVAVAGGRFHSLGLKTDKSIVAWGWDYFGQCAVPAPNADFVNVTAGNGYSLALKSDGSIVGWGDNRDGQCNIPAPNQEFVAVEAVSRHGIGLKSDGTVVVWGKPNTDFKEPEDNNEGFVMIDGGDGGHCIGLKSDGSIYAWGNNSHGECDVPAPNEDFVAVAAGGIHSLGLKADGSVVAWGDNQSGQCDVPEPNSQFIAIAARLQSSLGLKTDGTIIAWGAFKTDDVPPPNSDFVFVTAGYHHFLAIR